jgi:uncharacterized surface protein with fasciclin (FAS1) repeats
MKKMLSVLILGLLLGTGIVMAQAAQPANPATPGAPGNEAPATPGAPGNATPATPGNEAGGQAAGQAAGQTQDLVATLKANPDFSDYVKYLEQSGMLEKLNDQCPATLFVPVNSAFSANDPFKDLGNDQTKLSDALKRYMVQGNLTAEQLSGKQTVTTLGGNDLPVATGEGGANAANAQNMNLSVGGTALGTAAITTSNGCTIYPINSLFNQDM